MTEILTESFCERCGTRYTFQTAAPSKGRMKRLKVLSRGLRNYVLSDETSLEEAFADARSDEERAISSGQLDAFHQTFNFCMSCRQYTCANCWNGVENLCLTCAPDLSREVLPAAFPDLDPMAGIAPLELPVAGGTPANEDRAALAAATAWPDVDLAREEPAGEAIAEATAAPAPFEAPAEGEAIQVAGISAVEAAEAVEATAAIEPIVAPAAEPEAVVEPEAPGVPRIPAPGVAPIAAAPSVPPAPVAPAPLEAPIGPDERAAAAAAQTAALLARFRPDRDLDAALAAYELETVEAPAHTAEAIAEAAAASPEAPTVEPEREIAEPLAAAALAAAASGAQAVASEPEPVVEAAASESAAPVAAPEPVAAEAMPAAAAVAEPVPAEVAPAPAAPERRDDRVEIPTWRIVAPDSTSTQPAARPPAITPSTTPAWPPLPSSPTDGNAPQWPAAAFMAQPAARARDAMWAASSLELVEKAGGGVQACVSCGLPLSATARFCRRCGSRQG